MGQGDSFTLGGRCPEGSLTLAHGGGHVQRDHAGCYEQQTVDLLLVCLDLAGLGARDALQNAGGIFEKALDLVVEQDRVSVFVPGKYGHSLLDCFLHVDGCYLFLCVCFGRCLAGNVLAVELRVVACRAQQLLDERHLDLDCFQFHSYSPFLLFLLA